MPLGNGIHYPCPCLEINTYLSWCLFISFQLSCFPHPPGSPPNLEQCNTGPKGLAQMIHADPADSNYKGRSLVSALTKWSTSHHCAAQDKLSRNPPEDFWAQPPLCQHSPLRDYAVPFSLAAPAKQTLPASSGNQELELVHLTVTVTHWWGQPFRDSRACCMLQVAKNVTEFWVHFHNDVVCDFQLGWLLKCYLNTAPLQVCTAQKPSPYSDIPSHKWFNNRTGWKVPIS